MAAMTTKRHRTADGEDEDSQTGKESRVDDSRLKDLASLVQSSLCYLLLNVFDAGLAFDESTRYFDRGNVTWFQYWANPKFNAIIDGTLKIFGDVFNVNINPERAADMKLIARCYVPNAYEDASA